MKPICSDTIHVWHEPFTDGDECVCKRFALDLRPRDGCAAGIRQTYGAFVLGDQQEPEHKDFVPDSLESSPTHGDLQSPAADTLLRLHLAEEE